MKIWPNLLTASLITALAACADPVTMPEWRPAADAQPLSSVAGGAASRAAGVISLRYVCRNTFEVTNGWQVPAALYWRTADGLAEGFIEIPAASRATFDATPRSRSSAVVLYADAARTRQVATGVNAQLSCTEVRSGEAGNFITFARSCTNTFTLTNGSGRTARIDWTVPGTRREGTISIPPRLAPGVPMVLFFDLVNATSVNARFGALDLGTLSPASTVACREGPVLSWRLLGPSATGGAAVHSSYAEPLNAIFTSDGPDWGPGRVWRIDLATNQTSEIPSLSYPQGKYRQLVYDEGNNRLVTYWDGLGQAYALPITGGSWSPIGGSGNSEMYYEGSAFWNPANGQVGLWGGYGYGAFSNTFWSLDAIGGAWAQLAPAGTIPWPRIQPSATIDRTGMRLFITGGEGSATGGQFHPTQQFLSDLWSLDLVTQQWTNIIPVGAGTPMYLGPIAYVPGDDAVYRFGGITNGVYSNELARVDLGSATPSFVPVQVYGTRPSPRWSFGLHYDVQQHRLLLVSGIDATGWASDLWELRLP